MAEIVWGKVRLTNVFKQHYPDFRDWTEGHEEVSGGCYCS